MTTGIASALRSGALPPGITLSTSGVLSGTPTSEGSYGFEIRAQNGSPFDTKQYALSVRQAMTVKSPFASVPRPSAEVGFRFGRTFTATGGTGAYTWSLDSGALPAGLALNTSNGAMSGTPRAVGTFPFAVSATDAEGRRATASVAMIVAPKLAIRPLRLKTARLGRAYQTQLATAGGVPPLTWRVSGKLPLGVRFVPTRGALVGTPRRIGTYDFIVEARDVLGAKVRRRLALEVTQESPRCPVGAHDVEDRAREAWPRPDALRTS